jgi:hypothetical protein
MIDDCDLIFILAVGTVQVRWLPALRYEFLHTTRGILSFPPFSFREARQTDEFCSFSLICLAVERSSEPATEDGLTTDRCVCNGRVDDGQTNSPLFHVSVRPSSTVSKPTTADRLTTDRQILFWFTYLSGRQEIARAFLFPFRTALFPPIRTYHLLLPSTQTMDRLISFKYSL